MESIKHSYEGVRQSFPIHRCMSQNWGFTGTNLSEHCRWLCCRYWHGAKYENQLFNLYSHLFHKFFVLDDHIERGK